jgi:4-amino-4-deoxy-L-arabinose transferase-like glycosyltransferase
MGFRDKLFNFVNKKQNQILLFIILGLTLFWRLFYLRSIPSGLTLSEYNLVTQAINLTKSGWVIPKDLINNSLYIYLLAIIGKATKFNIVYLRLFQTLTGFLTVFAFYYFTKNWFNKQTSLLGSLLFAASAFTIALSRELNPNILLPLTFILLFFLITNGFRTNKVYWFVLTGIVFGLGLYISPIFLLIPIFFLLSSVYFYFKNPKIITGYIRGISFGAASFILTALPFLYFLPQNLRTYVHLFNPGSVGRFYLNIGNMIQSLFYAAPNGLTFNIGFEPLLDPFITITFFAGFVYAIFNLKRKKFFFLVGWFVAILIILGLQRTQDLSALLILLPSIYAISAVMMDYVLTSWVRTFPFNVFARIVMTFVFSLFLFMSIFYNYQKYFYAFRSQQNSDLFKYKIEYNK